MLMCIILGIETVLYFVLLQCVVLLVMKMCTILSYESVLYFTFNFLRCL
jgi:hypothetical protein